MTERRGRVLLVLLVIALGAILVSAPGRGTWVIDPDASAYVGLARSLAAGDGYVLGGVPHAKFPPGFPLLLSLAIRATGDPEGYAAMRDVATAMGLLSVLLAYAAARRLFALRPGPSLLVALAAATSLWTLQYSVGFLRSETTFTAAFLAALCLGQRWRERPSFLHAALAGLAIAAALSVRSAGLAGIAAIALARVLDLRPFRLDLRLRTLLEVALFVVVAHAPWFAHRAWVAERTAELGLQSSDYGDELLAAYALDLTKDVDVDMPRIEPLSREMGARVLGNCASLALSLGKFAANHPKGANLATRSGDGSLHAGGLALLVLLAAGWWVALRRGALLAAVAVAGYVALYLIWPFDQQQRFYQPVLALLIVLLAFGARLALSVALRLASAPAGRVVLAVAAAAVAVKLALAKSDAPSVFGLWSPALAALVAAAAATALGLAALAALARTRTLALERVQEPLQRFALAALALAWVASFVGELRALRVEQRAFEAQRAARPVSRPYERIKTDPELIRLFERIAVEAGPGDLVMSDLPKMIHVTLGLKTTPLRFSSARRELVLDTPQGRPTLLYYSGEVEQVSAVFDEVVAAQPPWLVPIHTAVIREGSVERAIALYRVLPP